MSNNIVDFVPAGPQRTKLLSLGFETLEQVQATAAVAGPELGAFIGVDVDQFLSGIAVTMESIPSDAFNLIITAEYPMGSTLTRYPSSPWLPPFRLLRNRRRVAQILSTRCRLFRRNKTGEPA